MRLYEEVEKLDLGNNIKAKLAENCRQTAQEFGKKFAFLQTAGNPVPDVDKSFIFELTEKFRYQALANIALLTSHTTNPPTHSTKLSAPVIKKLKQSIVRRSR